MKIKSIHIKEYGPISDYRKTGLKNFSVFYGRNEAGKSMTLEAILLLLTGARKKLFTLRNDSVDGEILIEDNNHNILRVTPSKPLTRYFKNIKPEDFREIFAVYASDLLVADEALRDERLSGIRRTFLQNLEKNTKNVLNLTDSGDIRKAEKDLLKAANKIVMELSTLARSSDIQSLARTEAKLNELKRHIEKLENHYASLKNKKLQLIIQTALLEIEEITKLKKELEGLKKFNEEEFQKWKESETRLNTLGSDINNLKAELRQLHSMQRELESKIENLKPELTAILKLEEKLISLEENAKRLLEKSVAFQSSGAIESFLKWFSASTFSGGAILTIFFPKIGVPLLIAGCAGFTALLIITLQKMFHNRKVKNFLKSALELGVKAETVEDIITQHAETRSAKEKLRDKLAHLEASLQSQRSQAKILEEKIAQREKEKNALEQTVLKISSSTGSSSSEEYLQKLREKTEKNVMLEARRKKLGQIIRQIKILSDRKTLGAFSTPEELRSLLNEILQGLTPAPPDSEERSLEETERELEKTQREIAALRYEASVLEKKIAESKNRIERVEKSREYALLRSSDRMGVILSGTLTPSTISRVLNDLQVSLQNLQEEQELRKTLYTIVKEVVDEEEKEVEKMFSENELISHYFSAITDGAYISVRYEPSEKKLYVRSRENEEMEASRLSSGTFDQLYLSIRLALAQKLLNNSPGFLIFDDPFIRSDKFRLKKQLQILLNLANSGWQILYFTAKEEVLGNLPSEFEEPLIGYFETPLG